MPDAIAEARMKQEQRIKDLRMAYLRLFSSEDGKKVLTDLANVCFLNKTTFNPENHDRILINEGARSVWLYVNRMMAMATDNPTEKTQTADNL